MLAELSKCVLHITSIKLSLAEHLDHQILSQDYDTEPEDILEVSGYGAQVVEHKQKWCAGYAGSLQRTQREEGLTQLSILNKERTAAKTGEMAENTECCVSYLR